MNDQRGLSIGPNEVKWSKSLLFPSLKVLENSAPVGTSHPDMVRIRFQQQGDRQHASVANVARQGQIINSWLHDVNIKTKHVKRFNVFSVDIYPYCIFRYYLGMSIYFTNQSDALLFKLSFSDQCRFDD